MQQFPHLPFFLRAILWLPLAWGLAACGGGEKAPFADCRYGVPQPIFSAEVPSVAEHHFELRQSEAVERLVFRNGTPLEIIQSGCDDIQQEYRFFLAGEEAAKPDDYWKAIAARSLLFMADIDPKYESYRMWAMMISEVFDDIKLSEAHALEAGRYVRIDKIAEDDGVLLVLVLSSR